MRESSSDLRDEVAPGAGLDARDVVGEPGATDQEAALDADQRRLGRPQPGHASAPVRVGIRVKIGVGARVRVRLRVRVRDRVSRQYSGHRKSAGQLSCHECLLNRHGTETHEPSMLSCQLDPASRVQPAHEGCVRVAAALSRPPGATEALQLSDAARAGIAAAAVQFGVCARSD